MNQMYVALFSLAVMLPSAFAPGSSSRRVLVRTEAIVPAVESEQARRIKLTVVPEASEARYRVREQLVGVTLPNDAVGKTRKISGAIVLESNGRVVRGESKFVVMLDSLVSDQSRRDNYVRRNTLQTAQFPTAEFVPTTATGLPASLPAAADLSFKLTGDFTVHGVTKPATWDVKGKMLANGEFTGTASTWFKFADYNMTVPRVAIVVSVVDSINLEMDLKLVPGANFPDR